MDLDFGTERGTRDTWIKVPLSLFISVLLFLFVPQLAPCCQWSHFRNPLLFSIPHITKYKQLYDSLRIAHRAEQSVDWEIKTKLWWGQVVLSFPTLSLQTCFCCTAAVGIFHCLWLSGTGTVTGSWPWHAWLHWHPSRALLCALWSWLRWANLSPQPHWCCPEGGQIQQFCRLLEDSQPGVFWWLLLQT